MTDRDEVRHWVLQARSMRYITGDLELSDLGRSERGEAKIDSARDLCMVLQREAVRWFHDRAPVRRPEPDRIPAGLKVTGWGEGLLGYPSSLELEQVVIEAPQLMPSIDEVGTLDIFEEFGL